MKKQITFILCCLIMAFALVAQPQMVNFQRKITHTKKHEQISSKKTSFIEKLNQKADFKKIETFLHQKPTAQTKRADWWEPDTLTFYALEGNPVLRMVFSYYKGNLILQQYQVFEYGKWNNGMKANYSYDNQNNLLEVIYSYWEDDQWEDTEKDHYTYDAQNNVIEILYSYWDGYWENVFKESYSYNNQNKVTELLFSSWEDNQWVPEGKATYSYFEENRKVEIIFQWWEGTWVNEEKVIATFDLQENLLEAIYQEWDYPAQWISYSKENFTYNTFNSITQELYQYWDEDLNKWENYERIVYTYDTQNNLLEWVAQDWWDEWINIQKNSYTYDAQNNRTTETMQEWDFDLSKWENLEKGNYTYDKNDNATSGFCERWENNTWTPGGGSLNVYYNNMQSVIDDKGYRFTASYVKPGDLSIPENPQKNTIKVYPNPTTGELTITNYVLGIGTLSEVEVEIYDVFGKKLSSNHLITSSSNHQINISHLPAGIYFLRVDGQTIKVVKQ